ncbi:hypothetical protein BDY21DRAFT_405364 [Lineolata rhizophorae]|uniref:Uncharacterized protein n=1 Tax=Lineolata rhizophorae TaxID=578093 RepID=A0A6A6NLN3_9PEZI|nr:hypothetical protein BDY21DRAFT_405364 [Lineolata rhizophorae]
MARLLALLGLASLPAISALVMQPRQSVELRWLVTTSSAYQEGVSPLPDVQALTLVPTGNATAPWALHPVPAGSVYPSFLLYDTKVATAAGNVCSAAACRGAQLAGLDIAWTEPPSEASPREGGSGNFYFNLVGPTEPVAGRVGAANIKAQGGWTQDDGHLLAIARGTDEEIASGAFWWDYGSWTLCNDGQGTSIITYNGTDPSCESTFVQLLPHDPYQCYCYYCSR